MDTTNVVEDILEQLVFVIINKSFNPYSFMAIIVKVMTLVEKYQSLTGSEKTMVAIHVMKKIVSLPSTQTNIPSDVSTFLKFILEDEDRIVAIINTIVEATKGKFDINKPAKCFGLF